MKLLNYVVIIILVGVLFASSCSNANMNNATYQIDKPYRQPVNHSFKDLNSSNAIMDIQFKLSAESKLCIELKPCVVDVSITNKSSHSLRIQDLTFFIEPLTNGRQLTTTVDLVTFDVLEMNQKGSIIEIKPNDVVKKNLDLASIKWFVAVRSVWEPKDFWQTVGGQKYKLNAKIEINDKNKENGTSKSKIGDQEVIFSDIHSASSNTLEIDTENRKD